MKPLLYKLNAFDARYEKTITYAYSGNQQFKNICTVRNNQNNTITYQSAIDTLQLKHTIPANRLTNGVLYNISIQIIDSQGNVSEESTPVLCYCFTTPTFELLNLLEDQIVQNASYPVTLLYNQPENEELQYYQLFLYNTNKNQIWSSGVKYDTKLSATIPDLEDNGVYYVRATGRTINDMEVKTEYIRFSVNYIMPSVYALVSLENIKNEGSIKIQSNILSLECKYLGDEPLYINSDSVDLTNSNNSVYLDEGFSLNKDFTINLVGKDFKTLDTILELTNGIKTIKLKKKFGKFNSNDYIIYYELTVPSGFSYYVIQSNYIDIFADTISIWITKKDNLYNLHVDVLTDDYIINGGTPITKDYFEINGGTPFSLDTKILNGGRP